MQNGKNDWQYWTTYIQDKNNTVWEATLNVTESANGVKCLYDICLLYTSDAADD